MKITPVAPLSTPAVDTSGNYQPARDGMKSIKMVTNVTPGPRFPQEMQQELPTAPINEPTQSAPEATEPLNPQLALLAKQRRALQVKERELLDREKAFQSQQTGSPGIDPARLKSETMSVLKENGITYDHLREAVLADQGNSEIYALKAEIDSLKKGIDQKFQDNASANEQQVLAEMRREADQIVRGSDEYELVREMNHVPKVMQLIERTYRENGEVLDVSEALSLVENELFQDAQKIARLKKVQSQFAPVQQPQQRPQGMRTLTNKDVATPPMSVRDRALAAFYGTLKK